jgi:hypothetical protein
MTEEEIKNFNENEKFEDKFIPKKLNETFDNIIIIDNLPKVPVDVKEKLSNAIMMLTTKQIQKKIEDIINFFMPLNEEKKETLGFFLFNNI